MMTPSVRLALPFVLAALTSQGCVYISQKVREEKELEVDQDGDGAFFAGPDADCDDLDPTRSPAFDEIPYDGIDNDCRGNTDLVDQDGDGFPGISKEAWEEATGRTAGDGAPGDWPEISDLVDCLDVDLTDDDGNVLIPAAQIFPGNVQAEIPYDGWDSDCAGDNDFDLDDDEYIPDPLPGGGDAASAFQAYVELWGYEDLQSDWFPILGSPSYGDCDDADPNSYPGNDTDEYYDGIDSDCAGDNDFDPDGDGYMPPYLPDGTTATQPAFNAYLQKYDLEFTLPEDVYGSDPQGDDPIILGAFDDCLDLGDPRVGAAALDAASIYPRAWSAQFGDNGDTPYDGIDTDCNRDNDFDRDRDAFYRAGDDTAYTEYVSFWAYQGEKLRWAEVNPIVALSEPGPDDCADSDPLTYPAALEVIERGGTTPQDQDCDGDENGSSFWFQGSAAAPVMEWKGLTTPRVVRLGNVYAVIVGAEALNQPGMAAPLSQNAGFAIPFPIDDARSQAVPSQPPFAWKSPSSTQAIGYAMDVVSVDRCRSDAMPPEELAFVYVEYVTTGAFSTFFNWFSLKEAPSGRAITVGELGAIGSISPEMETYDLSINLDGNCEVVLAGIADNTLWVSHGAGLVADLSLYTNPSLTGSTIAATFDPTDASGPDPFVSFEVCETGVCSEYTFDLAADAGSDPVLFDSQTVGDAWDQANSNWNKTDDRLVTTIPFSGTGLDVVLAPAGQGTVTIPLFAGENVISAYGQYYDGEIYVAAILEQKGVRNVYLAYGVPGSVDVTPLKYDPDDLPTNASGAEPYEIALFVDNDRIAVAMTMVDEGSTEDYPDTVGWVFLGPPQ